MAVIEDGGNTGITMRVDDHGRAYVRSNNISHLLHHSTYHHNLFVINYRTTLVGTGETPVAFFRNTSPLYDFEFYIINVEADGDCDLRTYVDAKYTSGGEAVTPINMFRGSGLTMPGEIYAGGASANLVLNTADQQQFGEMYVAARQTKALNFEGGLNFSNGYSAHLTAQGTAGTKVSLITLASWHDTGTEL